MKSLPSTHLRHGVSRIHGHPRVWDADLGGPFIHNLLGVECEALGKMH